MSANHPMSPQHFERLLEDVEAHFESSDPENRSWQQAYMYGGMVKELYPLLFMASIHLRRGGGPSGYDNLLVLAGVEKALLEMQVPVQKELEAAAKREQRAEEEKQAEREHKAKFDAAEKREQGGDA